MNFLSFIDHKDGCDIYTNLTGFQLRVKKTSVKMIDPVMPRNGT